MIRVRNEDGSEQPKGGDPKLKTPLPDSSTRSGWRRSPNVLGFNEPIEAKLLDQIEALEKRVSALETFKRPDDLPARPKPVNEVVGDVKPWIAAGVPKATWYRRRKKEGEGK